MEMPILRPLIIPTKELGSIARMLKWFASSRKWEVYEDFTFDFEGHQLVIPKGFVFDGASVPRLFWSVLAPTGLLMVPGLLHDFAYMYDFLLEKKDGKLVKYNEGGGKRFWDLMFRAVGQQVNGVHFANLLAWVALTCGGGIAWLSHRQCPVGMPPFLERGDEDISG
jgi:hypothetical protein